MSELRYTRAGAGANEAVSGDFGRIARAVADSFPGIRSFYALGSFAAGEGTMIPLGRGFVVNDYDFLAVFDGPPPDGLQPLARELTEHVHAPLVDIGTAVLDGLESGYCWNTQGNFDIRHARRLLHGSDSLAGLGPFESRDISPWAAIKLLLNRVRTIIEYCPVEDIDSIAACSDREKTVIGYNLFKTYVNCLDAVLIIEGEYRSSAEANGRRFFDRWADRWRDLIPDHRQFVDNAALSLRQKLEPDPEAYLQCAAVPFFRQTAAHLLGLFTACINRIQGRADNIGNAVARFRPEFGLLRSIRMNAGNAVLKANKGILGSLALREPSAYAYYRAMLHFLLWLTGGGDGTHWTRAVDLLGRVQPGPINSPADLRRICTEMAYSHGFSLPVPGRKL